MFRHEGPSRSHRANEILSAYLASIAGFVNVAGFVLLGSFTSHVTGNVGRFGNDLVGGHASSALLASGLVAAFVAGSIVTTLILTKPRRRVAFGYGAALLLEAILLATFIAAPLALEPRTLWAIELHTSILCLGMGMQNSLVTRLSGAVIRTTHLTGVLTDLGIEIGRWFRYATRKSAAVERPAPERAALLATIAGTFTVGSVAGAIAATHLGRWALCIPAALLAAAAAQAFLSETSRTVP